MNSKKYLIGITGGVAAYKSCELVRLLKKAGHSVQVVMSQAATKFVTPQTFQALSGREVFVDLWDGRTPDAMTHIHLSRDADVFLIAPASANTIAKIAHGICDDLISTLAAARNCPLWLAPAMNVFMWNNPANQRNVQTLRQDSVKILGPAAGDMACGESGDGRMLEAEQLFDLLQGIDCPPLLQGKHVVLTAGPTFEPIDPIRGLTNISSGKMGFALARACRDFGAQVSVISGPCAQATPFGVERIAVQSAREMQLAVLTKIDTTDFFIGVAAVSDFRPDHYHDQKIKKEHGGLNSIHLLENPDILASISMRDNPPFCVGFAAESEQLLQFAEAKRQRKKLPLLVANLAQHAMKFEENEATLLFDGGKLALPRMSKRALANEIVRKMCDLAKNQEKS